MSDQGERPETLALAEDEEYEHEGRLPQFVWANLTPSKKARIDRAMEGPTPEDLDGNIGIYSLVQLEQDLQHDRLTVAVGTGDEKVLILAADLSQSEAAEFNEIQSFDEPKETVAQLALSADASTLAAGCLDGNVQIYKIDETTKSLTMSYVKQLSGPEEDIEDIVWSPQGKVCMAVSLDRTAWLWKVESDGFKALFGHEARLIHGFFTKIQQPGTDKEMIAAVTTSADGSVQVWDPMQGIAMYKIVVCPELKEVPDSVKQDRTEAIGITSAALHPSKPALAVGTADGDVVLLNLTAGTMANRKHLFEGIVESIAFSPNTISENMGDFLLAAGDSCGVVKVCNASTLQLRQQLTHSDDQCAIIRTLWVDYWPTALVTVGIDSRICIWDPRDGRLVEVLHTLEDDEISVALIAKGKSPKDFFVIVGSEQGSLYAWQLE